MRTLQSYDRNTVHALIKRKHRLNDVVQGLLPKSLWQTLHPHKATCLKGAIGKIGLHDTNTSLSIMDIYFLKAGYVYHLTMTSGPKF